MATIILNHPLIDHKLTIMRNKETGIVNIIATVTCVAVDTKTNKMYRRLPECITEGYKKKAMQSV